jgi:hypothetical protein
MRLLRAMVARVALLALIAFVACAVVFQGCSEPAHAGRGRKIVALQVTADGGVQWEVAGEARPSVPAHQGACVYTDAEVAPTVRLCHLDSVWGSYVAAREAYEADCADREPACPPLPPLAPRCSPPPVVVSALECVGDPVQLSATIAPAARRRASFTRVECDGPICEADEVLIDACLSMCAEGDAACVDVLGIVLTCDETRDGFGSWAL